MQGKILEQLRHERQQKKAVVKARKLFCQVMVKKAGCSGAEVARFLGLTTSAVNRLACGVELPEVGRMLSC